MENAVHALDPFSPVFSAKDVVTCTSLDKFGVENYINAGHVHPTRIGFRRAFTALQMIHAEIVAQLASIFQIPPSKGTKMAEHLIMQMPTGWLEFDARTITQSRAWINAAYEHGQVDYHRAIDGEVTTESTPDGITLSFPVRLMARQVLARAHAVLNGLA